MPHPHAHPLTPARPRPRLPRATRPPSPPAARRPPGGQGRAQSLGRPPGALALPHRRPAARDLALRADHSQWQRHGRYHPESNRHPGKMLPALARRAIETYSDPGDLVLDPMCGIGTTLVEAIHLRPPRARRRARAPVGETRARQHPATPATTAPASPRASSKATRRTSPVCSPATPDGRARGRRPDPHLPAVRLPGRGCRQRKPQERTRPDPPR